MLADIWRQISDIMSPNIAQNNKKKQKKQNSSSAIPISAVLHGIDDVLSVFHTADDNDV